MKDTMKKDFLNQIIEIGDFVAVVEYGKNFSLASVIAFTPKKVRVKIYKGAWEELKNPHQLLKLTPEQVSWFLLSK